MLASTSASDALRHWRAWQLLAVSLLPVACSGVATGHDQALAGRFQCHGQAAASPREAAQLRGVAIRALGQEPGWLLEIVPGRWMHFRGDYGDFDVVTPVPPPLADGDAVRYEAQAGDESLLLHLYQRPCQDTMSGEHYPLTATVSTRGRQFYGCAESL